MLLREDSGLHIDPSNRIVSLRPQGRIEEWEVQVGVVRGAIHRLQVGPDAGKTFLAIYSLEGDRLVFCAAVEGQERPTAFRAGPGQDPRVSQREVP
jgi:hypothetical protein